MNSDTEQSRDDLNRLLRLVDQQISAHNNMANSITFKQKTKDIIIFAFSILLAAFSFVDPKILSIFFTSDIHARLALGTASLAIFFLSSLGLFLGWTRRAVEHESTSTELFEAKQILRELVRRSAPTQEQIDTIKRRYELINTKAPKLKDNQFLAAKAKHLRKVRLSKTLDKKPHASIKCLRIKFWLHDNLSAKVQQHGD